MLRSISAMLAMFAFSASADLAMPTRFITDEHAHAIGVTEVISALNAQKGVYADSTFLPGTLKANTEYTLKGDKPWCEWWADYTMAPVHVQSLSESGVLMLTGSYIEASKQAQPCIHFADVHVGIMLVSQKPNVADAPPVHHVSDTFVTAPWGEGEVSECRAEADACVVKLGISS